MRRTLLILFVGALASMVSAQEDASEVPGKPRDGRLDARITLDSYHPWTPPESREAWAGRRAVVRRQVLVAAGLWPEPVRSELQPVIHGAIQREGYTVEKVFFQSLPGFYVSGNLYRPTDAGPGPHPGVLSPHGHWALGRFTVVPDDEAIAQIESGAERHLANAKYVLQARCAQLARMGCVVLHYDMIGYADFDQLDHARGFGDLEAELWGMSWFGLQTLNSIRALDLLESLPDVDPQRIGVTGASGGGTQTFILGAVDERPDVFFPAVMVSTAMQGGCVCENASHLRVRSGNIELAAMAAPRPLGLTGANDWTVEIESKGLPELEALYTLLGVPDAVEGHCYPSFEHNYNRVSRLHMYTWMNRHLGLGIQEPLDESALVPIEPSRLSVFVDEHQRPADASDLAEVRATLREIAGRELERLEGLASTDPAEFRRVVGGALRAITHAQLPAPGGTENIARGALLPGTDSDLRTGWIGRVDTTDAVALLTILPRPAGEDAGRRATVLVGPEILGNELLGELVSGGGTVHRPAPLASKPVDQGRHGTFVGYTWCYNTTLFAERVQDVLTTIAHVRDQSGRPVALVGLGEGAPWALIACALAGDAVDRIAVDGDWDFGRIESLEDPAMLPGALRYGGVSFFGALLAPTPLRWLGVEELPGVLSAMYASSGASAAPQAVPAAHPPTLAAWILEE